ncbi:MAG: hypothetical protein ACLQU1_02435 [Bryobacteraceae bacterium]
MRRIHLSVGVLTVLVFLITGQVMRHHQPPMQSLGDSVRLMFRSRHIYILASGLVNLMLGIYVGQREAGWRRIVQIAGSGFLLVSPALLIVAFFVEPERGFQSEMWWSAAGLYALLAGSMGHVVSAAGAPRPNHRLP